MTNQSAFAYRDLGTTVSELCMSTNVNVASGTGIDLFRLRTAAGGPVIKAFVAARTAPCSCARTSPATTRTTTTALGTGWHNVELCGTVGTDTTWNLYRDGVVDRQRLADRHRHDASRPDPDR